MPITFTNGEKMKKIGFVTICEGEEEQQENYTVTKHKNGAQTATKSSNRSNKLHPVETLINTLGTTGIIAVIVIGTVCLLTGIQVIRGQETNIPTLLSHITLLIVGYFFGQQTQKDPEVSKRPIGFNVKKRRSH